MVGKKQPKAAKVKRQMKKPSGAMTCDEVQNRIDEYCEGLLPTRLLIGRMRSHIKSCKYCRGHFEVIMLVLRAHDRGPSQAYFQSLWPVIVRQYKRHMAKTRKAAKAKGGAKRKGRGR